MFRRPTIQSVIRNASHVGDKPAIIFVFAIAEKFNQAMRLPQLRYLSVLGFEGGGGFFAHHVIAA